MKILKILTLTATLLITGCQSKEPVKTVESAAAKDTKEDLKFVSDFLPYLEEYKQLHADYLGLLLTVNKRNLQWTQKLYSTRSELEGLIHNVQLEIAKPTPTFKNSYNNFEKGFAKLHASMDQLKSYDMSGDQENYDIAMKDFKEHEQYIDEGFKKSNGYFKKNIH
jgi:hypothetical protein